MTDDLEDFAQWRDEIETRVGTLEVIVETQAHTATLREHGEMLREHGARLVRLEAGQAKVLAGVQTIIGLLDKETGQTAE